MDFNLMTLYIEGIALLAFAGWGVYLAFFDKRIRVIIIHPQKRIQISKVHLINGERFNLENKTYAFSQEAVIMRNQRIPYCMYFFNNPNPIQIKGQKRGKGKDGEADYEFTAQEINKVLDTDYTIKLLTPSVNVKKIAMGMFVLIAVGLVIAVILHFTGVIDLKDLIGQTLGTTPPPD